MKKRSISLFNYLLFCFIAAMPLSMVCSGGKKPTQTKKNEYEWVKEAEEIIVKSSTQHTEWTVPIDDHTTVGQVKEWIEKESGIPASKQTLKTKGLFQSSLNNDVNIKDIMNAKYTNSFILSTKN